MLVHPLLADEHIQRAMRVSTEEVQSALFHVYEQLLRRRGMIQRCAPRTSPPHTR